MKVVNSIIKLVFVLCIISCSTTQQIEKQSIDKLFTDYNEFKIKINPIESTKAGYEKYNHYVANYVSDEHQDFLKTNYTDFLKQIASVNTSKLNSTQNFALKVMEWDCKIMLEGLTNELVTIASPMYNLPNFELTPLIQMQSLHVYFPLLASGKSVQPFRNFTDYQNWLMRVKDYLGFIDTCILQMREGIDSGMVLPRVLIERIIPQVDAFINTDLDKHLFYQPVLNIPKSISENQKKEITAAYSKMILQDLIPKYQELKDFLVNEYLPEGRTTDGIGSLPGGEESYNYLIKLHTTTNMTADEIHELGLSEVRRVRTEMENTKNEIGFEGTLEDFLAFIRSDASQKPFKNANEVLDHFQSIHSRVDQQLDQVFDIKPNAGFNIKRTEKFREASASAEYVPGSKDGKRAGTFYVPIPNASNYNKYTDEALFLHEAIPGHHYQLSLQQENKDLPAFLHPESMGVFVEGWALYTESLGKELGLYKDPYQYFGMLSMEMHRAIRLVVDSGIHAKGWTRAQAIQFSLDNEAESEAAIANAIERYMATPGQALSYKIGQLKIRALRDKASQALGNKFDIKAFHTQILNTGSLPLVLLEEKINNWIKKESGS